MLAAVIVLFGVSQCLANSGIQVLFPAAQRQYTYEIKSNITCGTLDPVESHSYWTLEGKLLVQPYDGFKKARYTLQKDNMLASIFSKGGGFLTYTNTNAAWYLSKPWEVEYENDGAISCLYVGAEEPLWATNMKRAITINFQMKLLEGTYYNYETCLYETTKDCKVLYVRNGGQVRKHNSLHILSEQSGFNSWVSVPVDYGKGSTSYGGYHGPLDNIGTADRLYQLDEKLGLKVLELKSVFQHKTRSHVLAVSTELSLNYEKDAPLEAITKLPLVKTDKRYIGNDNSYPTNEILKQSQFRLRSRTYELLYRIANKSIEADNIVRNASKIHSFDFVNLLNKMTQLELPTLHRLFESYMLGTSYETETFRNIFLEVLPHVRTNACALFIKYLVLEQKSKIEESTLLALIRKLPFNVANHSQTLLEELEVFTRLGLDYSLEVRHAGVLSFATLVSKAVEVGRATPDYVEDTVVKYFRMFNDCPQYIDRLVWLQGLSNMRYWSKRYLWTIYNGQYSRHERLWAILGSAPEYSAGFPAWHILTNESEHIQLRIAALHSFLSYSITPSELLSLHYFIRHCRDPQLKRFWYTTVKSLEGSNAYNSYKITPNYIPYLRNHVTNPDLRFCATNNHIVGTYDAQTATGAMLQLLSIGNPHTGVPDVVYFRVKTVSELMATSDIGVFIKAEGVATNIFRELHPQWLNTETMVDLLKRMKIDARPSEKVHVEIVVSVHEKIVYATHFNQSSFQSWNGLDLAKTVNDFLRFGSHINQQMVYFPFQLDAYIPTELGTPVHLQTTIVSFSSIRGNLTAPAAGNATWKNDLHLRYQATAVTSLSTAGPMLQSEHAARVQQSCVAHLPMKFDVTLNTQPKSIEVKWPRPGSQDAGVAVHARTQITMEYSMGGDVYTVNGGDDVKMVDETSVFFDCERAMSFSEVAQKLLTSNTASYGFLTKLRPSLLILNGLLLLSAPPPGSCGLVIGGKRQLDDDSELVLVIRFEDADINEGKVAFGHTLKYSENSPSGQVYFLVEGTLQLQTLDGNLAVDLEVRGDQPLISTGIRKWAFTLHHKDSSFPLLDVTANSSALLDGELVLGFNSKDQCPTNETRLQFEYRGIPSDTEDGERHFEMKMSGCKLPKVEALLENGFGSHPVVAAVLSSLETDPWNATADIKEKAGDVSVVVNGGKEMRFRSESLAWLVDVWTNVQTLKKFGTYRECRLRETTIETLTGSVDRLPESACDTLVLADCSDKPRFAVVRLAAGGVRLVSGGGNMTLAWGGQHAAEDGAGDFRISRHGDTIRVHSPSSGVQLYSGHQETIIAVPHFYMDTACGACLSQPHQACT